MEGVRGKSQPFQEFWFPVKLSVMRKSRYSWKMHGTDRTSGNHLLWPFLNSLQLYIPILHQCFCKILFALMEENIFFCKPLPELHDFCFMT